MRNGALDERVSLPAFDRRAKKGPSVRPLVPLFQSALPGKVAGTPSQLYSTRLPSPCIVKKGAERHAPLVPEFHDATFAVSYTTRLQSL